MGRHAGSGRWSSRLLILAFALTLLSSLLSAGPAAAHNFTKTDGDDARGLLDLRSASVTHKANAITHTIRTFAPWSPVSLGRNSSGFVIGIDKNNDARQAELCVSIFRGRKLRAVLTDCIQTKLANLFITKPNRTTIKIDIRKAQTGLSYRWAVVSLYFEKKPCLNGCFDGIPNFSSFILHDLIPPTVTMDTTDLRVWEADTDANFGFPFSVSDTGGAGVATWRIQKREPGGVWLNTGVSGAGGGAKNPTVPGDERTRNQYRVVVVDNHANRTNGPDRLVYIPADDDDLSGSFSAVPATTNEAAAFGGSYSQMSTGTFTYTWTPGTDCLFELIGPGSGTWDVTVTPNGGAPTNITDVPFVDQPRQTLYSDSTCATGYVVTWNSGTFGLDAVLG